MNYRDIFKEDNIMIRERYDLSMERIESLLQEDAVKEPFVEYFKRTAGFILMIQDLVIQIERDELVGASIEELQNLNKKLYEDILEENYAFSYANPSYAAARLGEEFGPLLCFLYTEIRGMIVYAYEHRLMDITINCELFIEIYNLLEDEAEYKQVKQSIYWFVSDYIDVTIPYRIREQLDANLDFAVSIIMESNLSDLRYLYKYGEYISENELETAAYLLTLSQDEIDAMAATYTTGYYDGFINTNKDISGKKLVNIRYSVGFERMVKAAIKQFHNMGLTPVIYRAAVNSVNKKQHMKIGYSATSPNKQYDYDHRFDNGLYLDKAFIDRKLTNLRMAYELYKKEAKEYAGPAVIEIFGELSFEPVNKVNGITLDEKQQKLSVLYAGESAKIGNEFINPENFSFTIIAYPMPEIGAEYKAIFKEIVKVNTLDKEMFKNIQQTIIDTLDQAQEVYVKGKGSNGTDITVKMHAIKNPQKETNFENCLADVNIPVGEVFTSPRLSGSNGILNVSEVYLNDLKYKNLSLTFQDGMVTEYSCSNFETEEENKSFIKENLLYNRETLPIGEFAIGTNTTAYVMAHKYNIVYQLPILIVEKMGPHFAVGDTCFSYSEDNKEYNPDGKEIVAKDNECSLLRYKDIDAAYFNCHTDITIPYDEIGEITAILPDRSRVTIIKDGRFVLKGTEELNKPFH